MQVYPFVNGYLDWQTRTGAESLLSVAKLNLDLIACIILKATKRSLSNVIIKADLPAIGPSRHASS